MWMGSLLGIGVIYVGVRMKSKKIRIVTITTEKQRQDLKLKALKEGKNASEKVRELIDVYLRAK